MNVVYSSSDSYCEICGISILSLLENNKNVEDITVYLIDNHISDLNKQKLIDMVSKYGRKLIFVNPPNIEELAKTKINVGRWNISTFYRLFLPTILDESVDKVLFIDCDTIVLQDLSSLWNMDLEDKWLYGVDDCRSVEYRHNIGLQDDDNYINNGVLLIDIDAWKKNNVEDMFIKFIHDYEGDITYVDQGVQNGVLSKMKRSGILHTKYNVLTIFFDFNYKNLIKLRRPPHPVSEEEYNEATTTPAIVHFQSCFKSGKRPWVKGCKHPFVKDYLAYKAMSPWKDEPFRKDDRTFPQKVINVIANILPQHFMVWSISILHRKVYPFFRNIKKSLKKGRKKKNEDTSSK